MSDYDSGDELLESVNADTLVTGAKRSRSPDDQQPVREAKVAKHSEGLVKDEDDFFGDISKELLKEKFGYDNFRHEQFSAIKSILRGDNVLVIFPTGAGKSLCYQVKSLACLCSISHSIHDA